ncbi:hypothetical protein OROMI_002646 [Orobanche minor]
MLSSQIAMDELFDLDLALTIPEDSMSMSSVNEHHIDAQSTEDASQMVNELPTVVMGSGRSCRVCLEGFCFGGAAGKQVSCGHVFHENCISQWLSIHSSCPLCRRKLSAPEKLFPN